MKTLELRPPLPYLISCSVYFSLFMKNVIISCFLLLLNTSKCYFLNGFRHLRAVKKSWEIDYISRYTRDKQTWKHQGTFKTDIIIPVNILLRQNIIVISFISYNKVFETCHISQICIFVFVMLSICIQLLFIWPQLYET